MAKVLYGAPVREQIMLELKEKFKKLGRKPVLAIVQVGDRDDSNIYIKNKIKFGEEIGVKVLHKKYSENIKEEELTEEIQKVNEEIGVDGIIVQLPLPHNLDREKIIQTLDPKKDVDGLTTSPLEDHSLVTPATARGVVALLDFYKIEVEGKKVAVIGRSKLAGGPIAELLKGRGGEVVVCHRETKNIATICHDADILISATGQAGLVTKEFVREGQVVVDVGINRVLGKLVGDVLFEEVEPLVSAITPVPGGIGPLTVACLFENLLDLCYHRGD